MCLTCDGRETAATGNLHSKHRHSSWLGRIEDLDKALTVIVEIIELGTADKNDPARHVLRVEIRLREWNAVSTQQDVGVPEERSVWRNQT